MSEKAFQATPTYPANLDHRRHHVNRVHALTMSLDGYAS